MINLTNGEPMAPEDVAKVKKTILFRLVPHPTKASAPPLQKQVIRKNRKPWEPTDDEFSVSAEVSEGKFQFAYHDGRTIFAKSEVFDFETTATGAERDLSLPTAHETQQGQWVTIPGLTAATNAMLVQSQQAVFTARDDAHKMIAAMNAMYSDTTKLMSALFDKLADRERAEGAESAVFRVQLEKVMTKLEERDKTLAELSKSNLQLEAKVKNKESDKGSLDKIFEIMTSPMGDKILEKLKELGDHVAKEIAQNMAQEVVPAPLSAPVASVVDGAVAS